MSIKRVVSQIDEVINTLEDPSVALKGKGKLIGKLRSSKDLSKNLEPLNRVIIVDDMQSTIEAIPKEKNKGKFHNIRVREYYRSGGEDLWYVLKPEVDLRSAVEEMELFIKGRMSNYKTIY